MTAMMIAHRPENRALPTQALFELNAADQIYAMLTAEFQELAAAWSALYLTTRRSKRR